MSKRETASTITVGDQIECITVDSMPTDKNVRMQQFKQGRKFPVEFVTVEAIDPYRSNNRQKVFTFGDGRTLTVNCNSKVTTP